MAKDKLTEYDATAANNTVVGDVNLAENSALPSDMNNAVRELMSHQKEAFGSGTPLYVDQTNNKVGIGTSSPGANLDINGGNADGSISLALRSGDSVDSTDAVQIAMAFNGTSLSGNAYQHHIKSMHNSSVDRGNRIGFFVWEPSLSASDEPTRNMLNIDAAGNTQPLQPAFLAFSPQINNIGNGNKAFTTEVIDRTSDYNAATGTFTAPAGGLYLLTMHVRLEQVDTAAAYYQCKIVTSNRTYTHTFDPNFSADVDFFSTSLSVVADMDASDTAVIVVDQSGGATQTDIHTESFFSGFLLG